MEGETMRILVVAHHQNDGSPSASFIHDQIKAFRDLGYEVRVIVPIAFGKNDYHQMRLGKALRVETIDGIMHFFLRYFSISHYGEAGFNANSAIAAVKAALPKILADFLPDVVHAHTLGFDSEIGVWLKEKISCPLVVTTHGSDTNIPFQKGKERQLRQWCDHADAVVCVGGKLKEKLLNCGVTTDIHVIPNGFNSQLVQNADQKTPNSIIQVGNLVSSKHVNVTIMALKRIREKCHSATLTVVGRGPEEENLKKLCKELALEDAVFFTGQVPNLEVFRRMAQAEYYVMVSSPEGFGIVYLEAMASKCLTIGTIGEGIADIIVSGENGFLLPPDDPNAVADVLLWAIDHPEEKKTIVQNGYECALKHTWKENAGQYLTLFHGLMND